MSKQRAPASPAQPIAGMGAIPVGAAEQQRMLMQRQPRPRLHTYRQPVLLTGMCIILCLLLVVLLATVRYREILPVAGVLQTARGSMKVSSPQPGIVKAVHIAPGDYVKQGMVLLTVNTDLFDGGGTAFADIDRQRLLEKRTLLLTDRDRLVDQFREQSRLLESRIQQSESRSTTVGEGVRIVESQLSLSESQLSRLSNLVKNDGLTQFEFEREQMRHLELLAQQTNLSRQAEDIKLESQGLHAQLIMLRIDYDRSMSEITARLQDIDHQDSLLQRRTSFSVIAHEDGIVSSLLARPGGRVSAGESLVYLQPQEFDLVATILVPGSVVGKLTPGQQTLLRYDSFNYHSYGRYEAEVVAIERSPLNPREHILPLNQVTEPVFRVLVKPLQHYVEGPEIYPLLPGMTLTADFVVNELTFFQFMFKPFLGLQGIVA